MLRMYVPLPLADAALLPILAPTSTKKDKKLFVPSSVPLSNVIISHTPAEADLFLIPHNYFQLLSKGNDKQLDVWEKEAALHNLPVLLFAYGDSAQRVNSTARWIVRTSVYKSIKDERELVMPPLVQDLGKLGIRGKVYEPIPVVGFCGWSKPSSVLQRLKLFVHSAYWRSRSFLTNNMRYEGRIRGLYIRQKLIYIFNKSSLVKVNFIERTSYSAHINTISLSPDEARADYFRNFQESHFMLTPRGDGNYSARFYEALSAGVIPIIPDTDIVLPFEESIPYEDFVVRIPLRSLGDAPLLVQSFYKKNSNRWDFVQEQARDYFRRFLAPETFFNILFKRLEEELSIEKHA